MFPFARRSRLLVVTLCVAVAVLRVAGLHLHLCLDGSEPPVSMHLEDSGVHHLDESAAGESHTDRDLAIASDVLVKKPVDTLDLSLPGALCALLLFLLARPRELNAFSPLLIPARSARTRLRPPLRGPPRLA
jgi:hypothetical protein